MHPNLHVRRRVIIKASQGYTRADQAWHDALVQAAVFVPDVAGKGYWQIGNPGSRIRRFYDERERALQRLQVARLKLQTARDRSRMQDRHAGSAPVFFIEYHSPG